MPGETRDITHDQTYWDRLGALPAAIMAMVHRHDALPYISYWLDRTKGGRAMAEARVAYLYRLIAHIRTSGYDPTYWRTDTPQWDPVLEGFGPIMVVRDERVGVTWPRDGSHRAGILKALGLPVIAEVWTPPDRQ